MDDKGGIRLEKEKVLDYERDWEYFKEELFADFPEEVRDEKLADLIFKSISN